MRVPVSVEVFSQRTKRQRRSPGFVYPAVQERDVTGVDAAFHRLQEIALLQPLAHEAVAVRNDRPLQLGQRRAQLRWTHVRPDKTAALLRRIRDRVDLVLEIRLRRLVRHVETVSVDIELPAVVDAAQPRLLISAEEQGCAAVRAVVLNEANLASGVAKSDEVLTHEADAQWIAIRRG